MANRPLDPSQPERSHGAPVDAAGWVVRLHSDQAVRLDGEKFDQWKNESAINDEEFRAHEDIWREIGRFAGNAEARAILMRSGSRKRQHWQRRALLGMLGMGAVAAAIVVMIAPSPAPEIQVYQTARGEQRNVLLEDGSAIVLNTDSTVRVSLDQKEHRVLLERGEFFVKVAKDPQRPFRVFVANHEVRALGTAFYVYTDQENSRTQVTLDHGIAAIYDSPKVDWNEPPSRGAGKATLTPDEPAVILKSNQRATFTASPAGVSVVDVEVAKTWREGVISFDQTSLYNAIKDVNRYRK